MNKLLTAGREMIKGNFGTAVKSLSIAPMILQPETYNRNMDFFMGSDGVEHKFTWKDHCSSLKAYTDCPPVTAIINRKAQAYINGKTWVMNTQGKEANTDAAKKIKRLLAKPNPLQSWKQFEAQQEIYTQLFGFSILFPIIPAGFDEYGPIEATSMWNLPPYMLSVEETNKLFYQTDMTGIVKNIKLTYKGNDTTLDAKNLYIFKDITPSFSSMIFPESRIRALSLPINNIIGAFESRNVLINYRGALGVLSHEQGSGQYASIPIGDEEKQQLQNDFRRYGMRDKQWKFIITSASLKWQQMGISTRELMLMEEVQESTKSICDAYGYPPHLLGLIDPTFNNQNAAEKGFYQNTIIPEAESAYEQWNNVFRTSELNLEIQKDFSHLPVLQDDMQSKSTARRVLDDALEKEFKNNLITQNRWLELIGEDTRVDGNVYYSDLVAQGKIFGAVAPPQSNQANGNPATA
jgi:hypothetical protein